MLSLRAFSSLIENGPLISIDLLVETDTGFLLGKRIHKPAKGYWFVPGGRVFKNETIDDAIQRISFKEIHKKLSREDLEFYGVFEHFYSDSFVSDDVSTHYVVLAYKVKLSQLMEDLPLVEHEEYKTFTVKEIIKNDLVHSYTKQYFIGKV